MRWKRQEGIRNICNHYLPKELCKYVLCVSSRQKVLSHSVYGDSKSTATQSK